MATPPQAKAQPRLEKRQERPHRPLHNLHRSFLHPLAASARQRAGSAPCVGNVRATPNHPFHDGSDYNFTAYTSLLRITTTPPMKDGKDESRDSTSVEDHVPPVSPVTTTAPSSPTARTGIAAGIRRAFGRTTAPQPDLERGQVASAVATA